MRHRYYIFTVLLAGFNFGCREAAMPPEVTRAERPKAESIKPPPYWADSGDV